MDNIVNKEKILNELSQTFKSGKTKSYEWRKTQLKSLFKMVEEQENKCFQVLFDDIGKDKVEAFKDEVLFIYFSHFHYQSSILHKSEF